MTVFIHKDTGAIVTAAGELSGAWIRQDSIYQKQVSSENLTVAELKSSLIELGVAFDDKAKKAELLALYNANKGD